MSTTTRSRTSHSGRLPYAPGAPDGVCPVCYTAHERYSRPFVVWCVHTARLVQVTGRRSYISWPLAADELLEFVRGRGDEAP